MVAQNLGSTTTTKITNYPLNAWYVAAWDYEVTRNPMSRTIADRPLALYRTEDGKPVALADACWHRLAPCLWVKRLEKMASSALITASCSTLRAAASPCLRRKP